VRDRRDLLRLEKDETVLNTFKGGLELMGTEKALSGILVLTNQNIIFLKKGEEKIFSTRYKSVSLASIGRTRHPSVTISLITNESIRFFTGNKNVVHMICSLILERMSAAKTEVSKIPAKNYSFVKEIIKEKEVIVKVRCPYCAKLYDETENQCPYCSGSR
jgi:hypothetical protein